MAETDIERRLREAGDEFIDSHRRAETAIRQAARVGMPPESIAHVSGLSRPTVDAFVCLASQSPERDSHDAAAS